MSTLEAKKLGAAIAAILLAVATLRGQQPPTSSGEQSGDSFRFKSGVELINVTATVTDASGRFVPDLTKEDFLVYEDDQLQTITHFNAERVPVLQLASAANLDHRDVVLAISHTGCMAYLLDSVGVGRARHPARDAM